MRTIRSFIPLSLLASVSLMAEGSTSTEGKQVEIDADEMKARRYFRPADLASGFDYLKGLMKASATVDEKGKPLFDPKPTFQFNFDPNAVDPAEGFGLLIQPHLERNPEKGEAMILKGFIGALIPDFEVLAKTDKGAAFIANAINEVFGRKLKAIAADVETGEPVSLPTTLEGFIERSGKNEGLKVFTQLAKDMVKALKKRGLTHINRETLRNVLMSKSYAETVYKLPQTVWITVLDVLSKKAAQKGLDGSIFASWKETRDARSFDQIEQIDLSELLGDDTAASATTEDAA